MQTGPKRFHSALMPKCRTWLLYFTLILFALSACVPTSEKTILVRASIVADSLNKTIQVPVGSTVEMALKSANITLNNLDRVEPAITTPISADISIKVVRVREEYKLEEESIAFERQTVRNEALPEGQTLLIQPGINGNVQITYRIVFEENIELSKTVFKTVTTKEPSPEIVMVGVQTPFIAVPIRGRIVYITAGNVWLMEENTGNRRPVLTSGDLDGHVFSLSQDGNWLLFTRKAASADKTTINTLWAINLKSVTAKPIDLRVKNIIHYADWVPGSSSTITYSTVEPRETAPGWQANNDLQLLSFNPDGVILKKEEKVATNNGGIYGWWGTNFAWSPQGDQIAYSRPDGIGLVQLDTGKLSPLVSITPYQTRSDWAWVPGIAWLPDSSVLYTVTHGAASNKENPESSPIFDLGAYLVDEKQSISLVSQSGMFSYPAVSPIFDNNQVMLAFLQSIFPDRSDTSRYKLMIMDRDASNQQVVFPPEGSPGLDPQTPVWSPASSKAKPWIAFIYQGNLWIYDTDKGIARQITGDGSITRIAWK